MNNTIVFIGAGNLATQLSKALQSKGFKILQVYSRSEESASLLADILSTKYTTSIKEIDKSADLYFVALKDSIMAQILSQTDFNNKMLVHCSGSMPLSILESYSENVGVLYPLQTFSKSRFVDFNEIPVFVESNLPSNETLLKSIAEKISDNVLVMNSEQRKILHVSAVFACNFVNYFYTVASEILKSNDISFDVLKPLILETASKVQQLDPENAQTGPAVRFDKNIIDIHLKELENFPDYHELYKSISKRIFDHHKK